MKTYKEFINENADVTPLTLDLHNLSTKVEGLMQKIIKKYEKEEGGDTISYGRNIVVHSHGNIDNYADFLRFGSRYIPDEVKEKIRADLISGFAKITKRKIDPNLNQGGYWYLSPVRANLLITKDGYEVKAEQVGGTSGGIGFYYTGKNGSGNYSSKR